MGKAFSFRLAEFAPFFASEKPSKPFFSDFGRRKARFHKPDSVAFSLFYCLVA